MMARAFILSHVVMVFVAQMKASAVVRPTAGLVRVAARGPLARQEALTATAARME